MCLMENLPKYSYTIHVQQKLCVYIWKSAGNNGITTRAFHHWQFNKIDSVLPEHYQEGVSFNFNGRRSK